MIECNPLTAFGQPILKGRRLTVFDIVTKIFYESNLQTALLDYEIQKDDAIEAVSYCKNLKCRADKTLIRYCSGCILRTFGEGWTFNSQNLTEIMFNSQALTVANNGEILFPRNLKELENAEFGLVTWIIAKSVLDKLEA
jgi:uncharacterized protein (DUF433 family)